MFKGSTEENFSDWSFIFESYLSCIDNRYISLLEQAKFSRSSMPNRALSEADEELSCQLYYILVMLLRGRPLDIAYNSGMGEGLESYRRIFEEFHPRVASRYVGTLTTLLSSKFGDDVEGDLAAFEKSVRRYEQQCGKTLDEEMLLGIVVNGLKDTTLQSHIIRNSSRLKSLSDVKTELLEISRTNRVLQNLPQPMDLGAAPWKKNDKGGKGKGKEKGKGSSKGSKSQDQGGNKQKGQGSGSNNPNPYKDKECWYCNKKGHIESECRKKIADAKAKPKAKAKGGGKSRAPHAASPAEGEEEPEPMSASPQEPDLCFGVVGAAPSIEASETEVLVDSGAAGSHLFRKGFDSGALLGSRVSGPGLVTVTGEPLSSNQKLKSQLETSAGTFAVEYSESEKVQFSVLSAGQAAAKGTWTVIGPGVQCMVLDKHAQKLRQAVENTSNTMQLRKKRGVCWLPVNVVKENERVESPEVLAATRAAKKTVPAKALERDGDEPGADGAAQSSSAGGSAGAGSTAQDPGAGGPAQGSAAGSSNDGPGADGAAQGLPSIGEIPAEVSEASRRPRAKRIPDTVSKAEFEEHTLTHLPMRSWCDHCMKGKVREDAHPTREPSGRASEVPRLSLDYCFLGRALKTEITSAEEVKVPQDEKDGLLPILVIVDEKSGCVFSGVIMMTDAENSIKALAESAAKSWGGSVQHQTAPKGSHASKSRGRKSHFGVGAPSAYSCKCL